MLETIKFEKFSGAGNDFVVIDNMNRQLRTELSPLATALCSRYFGVGADGLLVLEPSMVADFAMKYFNADGSYGGMCGNGGRCMARFAHAKGYAGSTMKFEALDFIYSAEVLQSSVILLMKPVKFMYSNRLIHVNDANIEGEFLNTGSPHFVTETSDLENLNVISVGRSIRHHPSFTPQGCNVNFFRQDKTGTISLRTYERGVESETMACGTGSVAAAITAANRFKWDSPIEVIVHSGETLRVHFKLVGDQYTDVRLEGSAYFIFAGQVTYDISTNSIFGVSNFNSQSVSRP